MAVSDRLNTIQNIPGRPSPSLNESIENNIARSEYEQDTNRLARGIAQGTIVQDKIAARRTNIPVALGNQTSNWSEPLPPYGASYPHNHVFETPNGIVREYDDTPNNVRYHLYHPTGTYTEVDANGTSVNKIIGDNYQIIERNGYIFIQGEANITVSGKCNVYIQNDANLQIDGNLTAVVKNDIDLSCSGNMNLNVKEKLKIKSEHILIETNNFDHTNLGEHNTKSENISVKANNIDVVNDSNYSIQTNNYNMLVGTNYKLGSQKISFTSQTEAIISAATTSVTGSNQVIIGSSEFNINADTIKATTTQKETQGSNFYPVSLPGPASPLTAETPDAPQNKTTNLTGLDKPASRVFVQKTDNPPLQQLNNIYTRAAVENDGGEGQRSTSLYPGYNDPVPYTSSQNVVNLPPSNTRIEDINVSQEFSNVSSFSGDEQLSKYVKLRDLTTHAIFGHRLRAQAGLSEGQIVNNLQYLATNVVDRLVERYGRSSFFITSCFRPESGTGSQHGVGQAIDIQFKDLDNNLYAGRAAELVNVIPFDQLILEYQSTGTGRPWFHISYKSQANRRQYFTMFNHRRVSDIQVIG